LTSIVEVSKVKVELLLTALISAWNR
jgi:hypothetical protein